ncbi:MAG: penicillin-binding protein [Atopostipes suicloacalis]|nr:penicillin-binding protein [Atopostipes suicloacalis]
MNSWKNRNNYSALLFIISFFAFFLIFLRFSQIMVLGEINGEDLGENVERLYTRDNSIQANRGSIYDRHGNPIALDAKSYKMIAILTKQWSTEKNPQHVQNKEAIANILSKHINLSKNDLLEYLNKDANQVEFGYSGNNLSYHTVENIKKDLEEEDLKGIIFDEKQKRLYPNGTFASHVIGIAQYKEMGEDETGEKELTGVTGLEKSFNDLLLGENGREIYQKDSLGYQLPNMEMEEVAPNDGDDLYISLNHKLQTHLEIILDKVQNENKAKAITANVLDAKTGEIIASSQRPSFDAGSLENIETWQNLLSEYTFEPGSTMKILTLAAAIEEGVYEPNNYFKSGTMKIHGGRVSDHNKNGWGYISELEGLSRSSNILFVNLVDKMGHDVWKEYLEAFGFAKKTGIELLNEQAGTNPYKWPLQKVNTGFGQGLTVTPIQMLQSFTAIANEGKLSRPKLIKKTVDSTNSTEEIYETVDLESPISKETAEKTLAYLKKATEMEHAVAKSYRKEDYSIAAKTGTAQLVDPKTGKYSSTKFVHSVASFFPAENPEYIVYITVQEPSYSEDARTGSEVVQKIYHPLIDRVIDFNQELEESMSDENVQYVETPSLLDLPVDGALDKLAELGNNYSLIGSGEVIVQQLPYPKTPLFKDQQVILMTDGAATMPDLSNWSRNDVLKVAELTGSKMNFIGEGYVVEQDLKAGSYIKPGQEITITLSSEQPLEDSTEEEG